jgi:hypothetical protein
MSFANINIGTTPGDHSGDPLRTAFNKINNNFQQIANGSISLNVNAPVQSVAGRTGNVILTVNDVIGAQTAGDVQAALSLFSENYPTNADLANDIATLVGGAPSNLNTIGKLATSLGNNTSFNTTIQNNLTAINTQITNLWSNAVVQNTSIAALLDDITAANAVIAQNSADIQTLYSNAATQAASLANLTSNAASQATDLITLTANAAVQSANLVTLFSNAATQNTSLTTLLSNAATQDASLTVLLANAAAQQSSLSNLLANTSSLQSEINGANAAIITANTALKNYVDAQSAATNQAWGANAEAVQSQLLATNAAIVTANTAVVSYVNASNTAMKGYVDAVTTAWTSNAATQASQLTGANAAIVTANTAMKGYVDAQVTSVGTLWTANAATQQGQIATLQSQVYSNSNVAAYLPTYTGALNGGNLTVGNSLGQNKILGNLTIGLNTTPSTSVATFLTVNPTTEVPIAAAGTLHVIGDYARAAQITLDGINTNAAGGMIIRRARGNLTVPTALQNGDPIGNFSVKGYSTTGFTTGAGAGLAFIAGENYSDTAQATYATINTTRPGANVSVVHTKFESNGNLVIVNGSPSTSINTGALVVVGGAGIAGNVHTSGNINTASWLTANSGISSNIGVYSPRYFFANGNAFSLPFDTSSAATFIQNYGGDSYFSNIHASQSTLTGDGSGFPLVFDFPTTITNHIFQAEGTLIANASIAATSAYDGALQVPHGGAGIQGNLFCATQPNTRLQVGQGGTYFGNVIGQFTGDVNSYLQVNMQNLHHGTHASSDFVATADIGTDDEYYINIGINNSTFNDPNYPGMAPLDSYLIADGGNLLISAEREGKTITFMQGGYGYNNVIGTWSNVALTVNTDLSVIGNISYTPANASNWNSSVTTIKQALDELAQRLKSAGF